MVNSSTSSSKRRFFIKLIIFLVLMTGLDAGIGGLLRVYYFRQTSGLNFRTTYAMEHSTADLFILGSSRTQGNYLPSIFEGVLETSCYNAGRDGQTLLYSQAVQQAILARHKPEVLVLDLIISDFFEHGPHYDKLSVLLPYYQSHKEIRSIVHLRSKYERIKILSQIYPFNSLPLQILKYNLVNGKEQNGHVSHKGVLELPLTDRANRVPYWVRGDLDPNMLNSLNTLAGNCADAGVELIVVVSPVYEGTILGRSALDQVKATLSENSLELWDYSDYPELISDPKLYSDKGHLNSTGAKRYTKMIADRIKTRNLHSEVE